MLSKWLKKVAPILCVLALVVPMVAALLPASMVFAAPLEVHLPATVLHEWPAYYAFGQAVNDSMRVTFAVDGSATVAQGDDVMTIAAPFPEAQFDGLYQSGVVYEQRWNKMSVFWDFSRNNESVKITYQGNHNGQVKMRLTAKNKGQAKQADRKSGADIQFGKLKYDWGDAPGVMSLSESNEIQFTPSGEFYIDPSVVGTTTSSSTGYMAYQRGAIYANGRYWVFHYDGTDVHYWASSDGVVWDVTGTVTGNSSDRNLDIWWDGKISYASYTHYRRGTLNADGSITWDAAEQTSVVGTPGRNSIAVDSSARPWVSYSLDEDKKPYASRSSTTDGTWTTDAAAGFPFLLKDSALGSNTWNTIIIPLPGNQMYAFYGSDVTDTENVYGRLYNGASWEAEETLITGSRYADFRAVADANGSVYLAARNTAGQLQLTIYSSGTWGAVTSVAAHTAGYVIDKWGVNIETTSNVIHWIYATDNTGYKIATYHIGDTTWSNGVAWISQANLSMPVNLSQDASGQSGIIGVTYTSGVGSPWDIHYAWIARPILTVEAETGVTMDKDGTTGGTFNYTVVSGVNNASPGNGDVASMDTWIKYGAVSDEVAPYSYAFSSTVNTRTAAGATTRSIPTNLTPGSTYYYRASADGWGWSDQNSMTLTLPTVSTSAATISGANITLRGAVSNMGVASSTYVRFQWANTSGAFTNSTAWQTKTDATAFSQVIAADPSQRVFYRVQVKNGATTVSSSETSFYATNSAAQTQGIANLFPLIFLAAAIGMFAIAMTTETFTVGGLVLAVIFLIMSIMGVQTIQSALSGLWGG